MLNVEDPEGQAPLDRLGEPVPCAAALPEEWRVLARRGWAGEKSGLFEHPPREDVKRYTQ